ncbi:MAG: TatD family hydrolase [Isosphaeraceae bacterium]|nr:TatD family hydrolase [Isosphaeraceae bacterium]
MTPVGWVDTHAHLDDESLRGDLAGVLDRARAAGVVQVVAVGTTADDSEAMARLAGDRAGIFAAVGIHPNHAAEARPGDWERIVSLVGSKKVVALGETGLDRYRQNTPFDVQQESFARHLALAEERGLPVVIHCRQSERDLIAQMTRLARPVRGVLHSFTGTQDDAEAFLDLGLHLSFAGMITFTNKTLDALRTVAARVPLNRLLVETDSPYLSPHPHRGRPNEPARVALTAARLAEIRGMSAPELARATTANARGLFGLPDDETL